MSKTVLFSAIIKTKTEGCGTVVGMDGNHRGCQVAQEGTPQQKRHPCRCAFCDPCQRGHMGADERVCPVE